MPSPHCPPNPVLTAGSSAAHPARCRRGGSYRQFPLLTGRREEPPAQPRRCVPHSRSRCRAARCSRAQSQLSETSCRVWWAGVCSKSGSQGGEGGSLLTAACWSNGLQLTAKAGAKLKAGRVKDQLLTTSWLSSQTSTQ